MNQNIGVGHSPAPAETDPQADSASGRRAAAGWRLLGALLLFVVGLLAASAIVPYGADLYDEGLIANGASLVLHGQLPGASFYAPYPTGAFWALALAFHLWGVRLIGLSGPMPSAMNSPLQRLGPN